MALGPNPRKSLTVWLLGRPEQPILVSLGEECIPEVHEAKYLGVWI